MDNMNIRSVLWSLAIGVFLAAGSLILLVTLFLLYGAYFLRVFSGSFPRNWSALEYYGIIWFSLYMGGGYLWNFGRKRDPRVDRIGRLLFSGSLFFTGIFVCVIAAFFATRPWELEEPVKSSFLQLNAGVGGLALVLMGTAVIIWRRARNLPKMVTMACSHCNHYIPEDLDFCPSCGKKVQ
ncbi:MAG: zinc ribbon domain-containing protein [Theionarchaea archaeon]|nr:zinc ribbon domain-containing protein [Theionarchaea archaeon]